MSRRSTCSFLRCLFLLLLGVARAATAATIHEFQAQGGALEIVAGSDGNLWFTQGAFASRLTVSGELTRFEVPVPPPEHPLAAGITEGPDGVLWMTDCGRAAIHRMTKTGVFSYFPLSQDNACPAGITVGPDGNLWFTEENASKIGRITPSGVLTELSLPLHVPRDITTGPDGNLWIIAVSQIGRLSPQGHLTSFSLGTGGNGRKIVAGPDGALWFTRGNAIGRISTAGVITEYPFPPFPQPGVNGIALGLDGNMWFTDG